MTDHKTFRVRPSARQTGDPVARASLPQPDRAPIECAHPRCHAAPQLRYEFPLPLCSDHLIKTLVAAIEVTRAAKREFGQVNLDMKSPMPRCVAVPHAEVVYYVRFGERIKIGTTTNLQRRLAALPYDELLATEPGGIGLEQRRHQQFKADLVSGREWFNPSDALLNHIASLSK